MLICMLHGKSVPTGHNLRAHLHNVSSYSNDALDEHIILEPLFFNNPSGRMKDDNVALLRWPVKQMID